MRHLRQWVLPLAMITMGLAALSATASAPFYNETTNYTYDPLGRLVKSEEFGANDNVASNYAFDKAGNRANVRVNQTP